MHDRSTSIPGSPTAVPPGFAALLLVTAVLVGGCVEGDRGARETETQMKNPVSPGTEFRDSTGSELSSHLRSAAWTGTTPGGVGVTVRPPRAGILAGPVRFVVALDRPAPDPGAVTVDLVAPEMPAHGILRFEAVPERDRRFVADVEVPMEGRWLLYVNLDVGLEAVAFEFHADPGEGRERGTPHHTHH